MRRSVDGGFESIDGWRSDLDTASALVDTLRWDLSMAGSCLIIDRRREDGSRRKSIEEQELHDGVREVKSNGAGPSVLLQPHFLPPILSSTCTVHLPCPKAMTITHVCVRVSYCPYSSRGVCRHGDKIPLPCSPQTFYIVNCETASSTIHTLNVVSSNSLSLSCSKAPSTSA